MPHGAATLAISWILIRPGSMSHLPREGWSAQSLADRSCSIQVLDSASASFRQSSLTNQALSHVELVRLMRPGLATSLSMKSTPSSGGAYR